MTGNASTDLPSDDELPSSVDSQRLDALHQLAIDLQNSGEPDFLNAALKTVPAHQRPDYRTALCLRFSKDEPTYFGSIEDLTQSLIATQDVGDSNDSLGFEATIDHPKGFAAGAKLPDLPPTNRANRDGASGASDLPSHVGKFLIKAELGRGAFGVVYLGFDEELQRNVAIKVSLVADKKIQEKLRIEASKVAQIESDGIVPVYHIGTTQAGVFYIVQKYIEGSTLRDIVRQGPLSPARATGLMRDIALGLEPAHLQDILHRDLKPDNILMEQSGRAWIADFGLAISESEQNSGRRELAGTLPYMSPEQINGRIDFLDPRSDLWALGVIYYELLTGKLPFAGKSRTVLTEQICQLDPRPLQQRAPGHLTEEMNAIFERCCAKKPSDRYATVREFAISLDILLASGLSDHNIRGESMEPRFGDSTIHFGTASGRFGSSLLHSRTPTTQQNSSQADTVGASAATGSAATGSVAASSLGSGSIAGDGHLSHRSQQSSPTSWWFSAAKVAALVVAATALSIGYQRITATPKDDGGVANSDAPADSGAGQSIVGGGDNVVASANGAAAQSGSLLDSSVGPVSMGPAIVPGSDADHAAPAPSLAADASLGTAPVDPESGSKTSPTPSPTKPAYDADGSAQKPYLVDASGNGSHLTIADAIATGGPGAIIELMPGLYPESIRITKSCTIRGVLRSSPDADLECEIENDDAAPITIDCPTGKVSIENIFIDGKGRNRDSKFNAVDVLGGTLLIADCDLETSSQNCVKVHRDANFGARDCHFVDANEFSISTKDHGVVQVTGCVFDSSGVQLVGGTGTISDCKFYGKSGVHVAQNTRDVQLVRSSFSGNTRSAISATGGGKLVARECEISNCEIGVHTALSVAEAKPTGADAGTDQSKAKNEAPKSTVGAGPKQSDGPVVDLFGITIDVGVIGVLADGNCQIRMSENCTIRGTTTAIGVGAGSVTAVDTTIVGSRDQAIQMTASQSVVRLAEVNLIRSGDTAVQVLAGRGEFKNVRIEDCRYAFQVSRIDTTADISILDVDVIKCSGVGLVIEDAANANIVGFSVDGGVYGIYAKGVDAASLTSPAAVNVRLTRSKFTGQSDHVILATGNTQISVDDLTWEAIQKVGGAQTLSPASVSFKDGPAKPSMVGEGG
ncbi:Serine/threonine-protein kinase PknB [Rubripirellula lacrimiformis]|uniref:Serine/threonine-protein kinase PknB n=1 Tax=Rubripirellula lacrimiformis TaxID=1930273 RepID=A0A517NBS2_9BACT|nr:serine/threonine-protein kinase [Rubripirellula lacrimiformis]QDT04458.1 Serine/threonine-protein kinase PknB [Rubripirellula lacrimiformis]